MTNFWGKNILICGLIEDYEASLPTKSEKIKRTLYNNHFYLFINL